MTPEADLEVFQRRGVVLEIDEERVPAPADLADQAIAHELEIGDVEIQPPVVIEERALGVDLVRGVIDQGSRLAPERNSERLREREVRRLRRARDRDLKRQYTAETRLDLVRGNDSRIVGR